MRTKFVRALYVLVGVLLMACTWDIPGLPGLQAANQLGCEEAVSRLENCCGAQFTSQSTCRFRYYARDDEPAEGAPTSGFDFGCNLERPSLDGDQVTCILGAECDALVRIGACSEPSNVLAYPGVEGGWACKR